MRSRLLEWLLAFVLVFATGCSSSSSSSSATDGGGADGGGGQTGFTADQLCALVTTTDVSAAVGATVNAGVPSGENAPSCTWLSADSQIQAGATIAAAAPSDVGQIPFGLQGNAGAHITNIPNLGDGADFAAGSAPAPNAELDMKKGLRAVTITVGNSTDGTYTQQQQEDAELAIANAAVKNM